MSELPLPPPGTPGSPPPAPPPAGPSPAGPVTVDSAGRRWYWDGTQWRPVAAAGTARRSLRWQLVLAGLILIGAVGFLTRDCGSASTQTISNAKIDSATQIEFRYHASSDCSNLTFSYAFYDSSGKQVDVWNGESSHSVQSGHDYHITASADPNTGQAIDSSATRFVVTPTCHTQ